MAASLVLIPVVLAVTGFGGLVIARRALAPMERMRTTLETIQAEDLSRRIDVHPRERELGQLVGTLNRLLDRLARDHTGPSQPGSRRAPRKQPTVRSLMGRFSNPAIRQEIAELHRPVERMRRRTAT